jgi:hypothetical protein
MHKLFLIARLLAGILLVLGVADAHAANITVVIDNQLSTVVRQTVIQGTWNTAPDYEIWQSTQGYGYIYFAPSDSTTRMVAYSDQAAGQACIFQVSSSYNATTGTYSVIASARPVGIQDGPYLACSKSIDLSSSSTGDFTVTFTLSGY